MSEAGNSDLTFMQCLCSTAATFLVRSAEVKMYKAKNQHREPNDGRRAGDVI